MNRTAKPYDAVASVRQMRDAISARIASMTLEEQLQWMASADLGDPLLERLRERSAHDHPAQEPARRT